MNLIRIFVGIGLATAFIGWFFYRLVIKRDLKKHLNELYAGLFFVLIWALIYWFIMKN
jgi:high-affinity Fe2+/Pb2+ permease